MNGDNYVSGIPPPLLLKTIPWIWYFKKCWHELKLKSQLNSSYWAVSPSFNVTVDFYLVYLYISGVLVCWFHQV